MDLVSGYPFWLIKNGLPFRYEDLKKDIASDVVIMGAGISGALVAYYLMKAGVKCVVIDKRAIGLGSTCASTSLLQYEIDVPLVKLKKMIGLENAVKAYKLCEESIFKLSEIEKEVGSDKFEFKKSLYYASEKSSVKFLKEEFDIRKKSGFAVEYLLKDEITAEFGFDAPAAILSGSAAQTDVYSLTHALHQFGIKNGLEIYERTCIAVIKHEKNGVELKTDDGFTIRARKLIYATGYEAINYVDKKIVSLHTTYATVSERFTENNPFWKDDVLIWNTSDPYLYMRTTSDKRIMVGGRDEKFLTGAKRNYLIDKKTMQLKEDFQSLFPAIVYKPEFSWAGVFGKTSDGLPFIGPYSKTPNGLFALGFGGNGITFSVIAAKIIADLIKDGRSENESLFSFER